MTTVEKILQQIKGYEIIRTKSTGINRDKEDIIKRLRKSRKAVQGKSKKRD